ncbi:hypothetical protein L3i20_v203850 [Paenibacillus sp. L3-i20]|nr:hypothetical protein L3i20_v203850 [Paenibacillus sp. L3-i20]
MKQKMYIHLKKHFLIIPLAIVLTLLVSQTVEAYVAYKLQSVPAIKQEKTNWCNLS